VFEPIDDRLSERIRADVGAFLHDLFRRGAFAGGTPRDAYFVNCETGSDGGVVDVTLGFAPLKPAEFVVVSLRQLAGQPVDGQTG
jgi:phage tail sheath protein FI